MFETKFHFPTVTSTNTVVKELLSGDEYDSLVVSSSEQTSGRGRGSNPWYSPRSHNLYISFGIKHTTTQELRNYLTYQTAGCLAVVSVLNSLFPELQTKLKYPNDVFLETNDNAKKVSGVLVENEFSGSTCTMTVVGIGININQNDWPDELARKATSLSQQLQREVDYQEILKVQVLLIERFSELITQDWNDLFPIWRSQLKLKSKSVTYLDTHYTVISLNPDGSVTLKPKSSEGDSTTETITIVPTESLSYVP